jgi:micrococcal nuclease
MSKKEKVTRVIDGDTFKTKNRKNPVRLANVDAPEKGQYGSSQAKEYLKKLIGGEEVRIKTVARDKFGRSVARVYIGRESVNKKVEKKLKKKR